MNNTNNMIIYNLFPLLAGPFPKWGTHLERAARMGFNWIFVNPVQRPGKSGSLYSISDYYDYHPLLVDGRSKSSAEAELVSAIQKANELGMQVMIDLVVNHCSVDSELISQHPKWFAREADGRVANPFCIENNKKVVWRDLAKFDHRSTKYARELQQYFMDVVNHLISLGFKGFRCDAAYQVPGQFWKKLIRETKKEHPEVVFLAETLGCIPDETRKTAAAGFDYVFNSSKWWDFRGHWLMEQYDLIRETAPSVSFPESHDTLRLWDELKGSMAGVKQRYLFSAMFSAGVMMPMGYEFGFRKRLHVVDTRPEDWETTGVDLTEFIGKVNQIKARHQIFSEEAPAEVLHEGNSNVLVLWRGSVGSQEEALIILNKDIQHKQQFSMTSLQELVQAGRPLTDISPEYPMDYIPSPFSYDLNPGQGVVLVTSRDTVKNE